MGSPGYDMEGYIYIYATGTKSGEYRQSITGGYIRNDSWSFTYSVGATMQFIFTIRKMITAIFLICLPLYLMADYDLQTRLHIDPTDVIIQVELDAVQTKLGLTPRVGNDMLNIYSTLTADFAVDGTCIVTFRIKKIYETAFRTAMAQIGATEYFPSLFDWILYPNASKSKTDMQNWILTPTPVPMVVK
jgi:hypothetical protein